jgi:PAS domain S-box-containing protein
MKVKEATAFETDKEPLPVNSISSGASLIVHHEPGLFLKLFRRIQARVPVRFRQNLLFLTSFKNRILISALVLLIGLVVVIGAILGATIFPSLPEETIVIQHIKLIHFFASLIIIAIGWLFIDRISKKITEPLRDLTQKADQISRETSASLSVDTGLDEKQIGEQNGFARSELGSRDEIYQLTSSFNRMLCNLKASEARLIESEARYRFLFDNGPTPIFVIDLETMKILDVNARAEEEYGYIRQEFLKMNFDDLAPEGDRESTRLLLQHIDLNEIAPLPILRRRRKSGSVFVVNFQASAGRYENRPALMIAAWDATEKLEKQAKLIHASKMATLGEMATGIAHELNQPLYVIRIGCDYLIKKARTTGAVPAEDFLKVTQELNENVERASGIINHLREFGRRTDETLDILDINVPLRNSASLLKTQLEAHNIEFILHLTDGLPKIRGNLNRLEQVFINLIINARDAVISRQRAENRPVQPPCQHRVMIESYLQDPKVVVTISDTGPGIPESLRSKVFEPFFTTKKTGQGTGLGLAISYGIVKEHNGSIEIINKPEPGCAIKLSFPRTSMG